MDHEVPEPPWWSAPHARATQRSQISRDAVVDAALVVLAEGGLDSLSMRKVAQRLDVTVGTLYWHVRDKEQLLVLLLDRVIGEVPLPAPNPARWQELIKGFARDGRLVMRRYPDIARASLGRVPVGPSLLKAAEWQLALLIPAGIPRWAAAWFGDILALYVAAHAVEDQSSGNDEDPAAFGQMLGEYFAALPPARFPYLLQSAQELGSGSPDERFEFGLDLLVQGLAALAGPKERTQ